MTEQQPTSADVLLQVIEHLSQVDRLLRSPGGMHGIDAGLQLQLRYPITSFRQRFPEAWTAAQADPAQAPLF